MELNYRFVEEDIDIRYELEEVKEDIEENDDECHFFDGWTDEEIEAYYKWLDEEEEKKERRREEYSKIDEDEWEKRDFIEKHPTTDCDGCGEIHNTEDMYIGCDSTGEVVLVLCKKCAGKQGE